LAKPPTAKLFESAPDRYTLWDVASRKRVGEPLDAGQFGSRIIFDATDQTIAIGNELYDA
jgi:hypothetical protein